MKQKFSSLDEVLAANNIKSDTLSKEEVRHYAHLAMTTNSLAYVLADAAESFLMDCDAALGRVDRCLVQKTKQNFKEMHRCVHSARASAKKAASPMYETNSGFTEDACYDSDWWYNFIKLIDDRIGVNPQKTNQLLEFLLNMPSEGEGLFNPTYSDFIKG